MHAAIEKEKMGAEPRSMLHVLRRQVEARGDRPALHRRRGDAWEAITWRAYGELVERFARALLAAGLERGDRVAILGFNCVEWVVADLGAMAAGCVPVGIYTTSSPEQCAFILEHSGARVIVVDDAARLATVEAIRDRLPSLHLALLIRRDERALALPWVQSFDDFLARAEEVPAARYLASVEALEPHGLATLIYTSGTTGPPKGVMISHRNLVWTAARLLEAYGEPGEEKVVSYLPLSHVAEQMATIHLPITAGAEVYFATSLEAIRDHLVDVRPTIFLGVPRLFEKMQAAIEAQVAIAPVLRQRLFAAARGVGRAFHATEAPGPALRLAHALFDRLVYRRLRERLGMDRMRFIASSTAPIHPGTLDFFWSLGIPIHQIYGQSEASGPTTLETPRARRRGSVGRPLPGLALRIAEDGEVLVRGGNVFLGYFRDEAATREAFDGEGWLRSGDVGHLDEDGFLWITDRKKELIVTAGGKKTGPALLEGLLQAIPPVAHAVVVGDGKPWIGALLTLDPVAAAGWASERGLPFTGVADLARDPRLRDHLARAIATRINPRLARFETIKRFVVLPVEFTTGEEGELTPTLKLRRRAAIRKYAEAIERLYAEPLDESVTACAER